MDAHAPEDLFKPLARGDGYQGDRYLFLCSQFWLFIFGVLGRALSGVGQALFLQVLNIDIVQATEADAIIKDFAGRERMSMDLEEGLVACHHC